MPARHFDRGDKVEVSRDDDVTRWFPATVLRLSPAKHKGQIYVEYETLTSGESETQRLREYVSAANVRPSLPVELHQYFKVGDKIDAFQENAWREGIIADILENSRYSVSFVGVSEEVEFEQWNLRFHRDWDDGSWFPPLELQRTSELELQSREREMKFKIKYERRMSEANFSKGRMVEVKSNEEGYQGSWYTAVIVGSIGKGKFLVEYQTLKTEDETELLKEKADALCIRPCPPVIQWVDRFKLFEKVDAWYNDGWWVGLISKVLDGLNYAVYFWTTNEELEFGHVNLRPHQEWIGGHFVADFKKKSSVLPLKPSPGKLKRQNGLIALEANYFYKGMKVEVKSDEEGYSDSWYPAVIIGSKGTEKYLVEYRTLKTDDEMELLREEADALCIRPCPPVIQRIDPFGPFEEVDAWYNDAWWIGGVCNVLQGSKYAVYIRSTNEVLEFQHSDLRPHQDWTNGKWVSPYRGQKL